jgi:Zn-dependent protease
MSSPLLARIDFEDPTFWAVLIGWVMSVTLHEFAHGVVGYWGGDYTIRERGGLTLNPLQYVDPVMSLILPAIFLLLGGVPLPGGATFVRLDLVRSRKWESAVFAAGPLMNLILFGLLTIPLAPGFGWIAPNTPWQDWTTAQKFVAAMCYLQLLSVFLNLFPIPPLDGFGIIGPYLPHDVRERMIAQPLRSLLFFGFFMLVWQAPGFLQMIDSGMRAVMGPDIHETALTGMEAVFWHR